MSTRGRANAIRAALELREIPDPLGSAELEAALSNCLGCRACTNECPSNVNMALLKAELMHARIRKQGMSFRQRLIGAVDRIGEMGCRTPRLANLFFRSAAARHIFGKIFGFAPERAVPEFARERFDRWFARHQPDTAGARGRVILWDDTFVRYHEPHIGCAAVKVLEAAGYVVTLAQKRRCCGRPAFSQGNLEKAEILARCNIEALAGDPAPIIFLEPSCYSMFVEDYRELKVPGAEELAMRSFLFEEFIEAVLQQAPDALKFDYEQERLAIHTHCHAKALLGAKTARQLAARLPNRSIAMLDAGCCGMAGAFGLTASKFELSLKIAEPLMTQIKHQPFGTTFILSGTSCRHQVRHLANVRVKHMAEVLADALAL